METPYGTFASPFDDSPHQRGQGFIDSIKSALSGETATGIKNFLQSNPQYAGENHGPQRVGGDGRLVLGSYIGPGTQLYKRISKGSQPVSATDKTAQAHDLRYALSGPNPQKIHDADLKMVAKLRQLKRDKKDSNFNVNVGLIPMQAKLAGESAGILDELQFAPKHNITDQHIKDLYEKKLKRLEQEGYGTPAYNLKKIVLKNIEKLSPNMKVAHILKDKRPKRFDDVAKRQLEGKGVVLAGAKTQRGKGVVLAGAKTQRGGDWLEDFADGFRYGFNQISPEIEGVKINLGGPQTYQDLVDRKKARDKRDKSIDLERYKGAQYMLKKLGVNYRTPLSGTPYENKFKPVVSNKGSEKHVGKTKGHELKEQEDAAEKLSQIGQGYGKKIRSKAEMKKFMEYVRSQKSKSKSKASSSGTRPAGTTEKPDRSDMKKFMEYVRNHKKSA